MCCHDTTQTTKRRSVISTICKKIRIEPKPRYSYLSVVLKSCRLYGIFDIWQQSVCDLFMAGLAGMETLSQQIVSFG